MSDTDNWAVQTGDCLDVIKTLPDNSVDAIVTDPPYGLSFMGKKWDYDVPSVEIWQECLRVLKPGGYLLAFAGTRTQHRMTVRIEDAGFEIRDMIAWVYGSGFPKSMNVSKALDKAAGSHGKRGPMKRGGERLMNQAPNGKRDGGGTWGDESGRDPYTYEPATDEAKHWDGWGTALKPALEPITVARKPLDGTVAANITKHGTGALNIDGCRIPHRADEPADLGAVVRIRVDSDCLTIGKGLHVAGDEAPSFDSKGRWPAHLIHDGSEEVEACFPGDGERSAARFFYSPKVSKKEREFGLEEEVVVEGHDLVNRKQGSDGLNSPRAGAGRTSAGRANVHPTVKPVGLMRYLCRLVTPPGGTVLDPFCGSGSTGIAAVLEGFVFLGIEREENYSEIARKRIAAWEANKDE